MKYTGLSSQEIVGNWKLLKVISFQWMGQKWDCSGFILSTKQWKKSDWQWKGQGASRLEPKSKDDSISETVRVLSAWPVFADSFSNSLEIVTAESMSDIALRSGIWEVGNTKITAYIPVREDRQTKQLHPHSTPSTLTDIHMFAQTKYSTVVSNMD